MSRVIEVWARRRVVVNKGGFSARIDFPSFGVLDVDLKEAAELAANEVARFVRGHLRDGKDAHGNAKSLKASTVRRRQYDKQAPKRTHRWSRRKIAGKRGGFSQGGHRFTRRGIRSFQGTGSARWHMRFPNGGSKGGSRAFSDSGDLVNGIGVESESAVKGINMMGVAYVTVPKHRRQFINVMAKRGFVAMSIDQVPIGKALRKILDGMIISSRVRHGSVALKFKELRE